MKLPEAFLARMREQLGEEAFLAYCIEMQKPPRRALRVNTLKVSVHECKRLCPWPLTSSGIAPEGFLVEGDGFGRHPLHHAGVFYMQEASAMRPVHLMAPQPGMRVLDLCAAPGGKAGQIAARLSGQGLLVANELDDTRANTLKNTLARMGVKNALVTSMSPDALVKVLAGFFDAVLVDAPCSGEGMFRKEAQAVTDWSIAHVNACAKRQANILDCAACALAPGGLLVYSTCTFSAEENEVAVEAFLTRHTDFSMILQERHYPHTGPGEGQYVALMRKGLGTDALALAQALPPMQLKSEAAQAWERFLDDTMTNAPDGAPLLLRDGRLMLLPAGLPRGYERLRMKSAGVLAGEVRGGRFMPAHALCMAYPADMFQRTHTLALDELAAYFAGEELRILSLQDGYCVLLYEGFPVGWGNAKRGIIKNMLPKGLRER